MCGIIYAKNLKDGHPVNDLVKILYENQKGRGQEGFGFVGLSADRIDTYRATGEGYILERLNERQYDEIIFHHRFPTSTRNTLKSTHPFVLTIDDRRYYFMHNGVIHNASALAKGHWKRGITYTSREGDSFNDSEALAWDFCLWLNNQQERMQAEGSAAFVCLEAERESKRATRLYFYRNDEADLKIYKDRTMLLIASSGNYATLKANRLYFWDYREGQVRKSRPLEIRNPDRFCFEGYAYDYPDDLDSEHTLSVIKSELASLRQERDHLLSIGEHEKAEAIDDEIDDLEDQLKELRKWRRQTYPG